MDGESSLATGLLYASDQAGKVWNWTSPVRQNFYVVTPAETSFAAVSEIPDYVARASPFFIVSIVVEYVIAWLLGKPRARVNDSFSSLAAGMIQQMSRLILLTWELPIYMYIWNNFRIWDLTFESRLTWWMAFFGFDLGYYFAHRAAHEVNIFWAAHQVHHSSEEYNLTTALRQSALQTFCTFMFYMPLALAVPPTHFLVHAQLNLLYQYWIHTEVIDNLGPLEWVLNTPSHHRVHHGRNRYCIDKNYAGVLIIWDRIFGTFEPENTDDRVVYGLVHPLQSWDPIGTQICHYKYVIQRLLTIEGFGNKVRFLFYGPGWAPGKPRTGCLEDIPDIKYPEAKYDPSVPKFFAVYVVMHFLLSLWLYEQFRQPTTSPAFVLSSSAMYAVIGYTTLSLTSFGLIFDKKSIAPAAEVFRLLLALGVLHFIDGSISLLGLPPVGEIALLAFLIVSAVLWAVLGLRQLQASVQHHEKKSQ